MSFSLKRTALVYFSLTLATTLVFAAEARTPTKEGILYGAADGQLLTMDYYAPKGDGVHPIAIIIHGGGYHGGDSKSGSEAYVADFLAPAGYAVFSVNYRLAPKYPLSLHGPRRPACRPLHSLERQAMECRSG